MKYLFNKKNTNMTNKSSRVLLILVSVLFIFVLNAVTTQHPGMNSNTVSEKC